MADLWHLDPKRTRNSTAVPYPEAMRLLASALDPGVRTWESFEMRLFGARRASTGTVEIAAHHVYLEGCPTPAASSVVIEVLERPAIWRVKLSSDVVQAAVTSWADGDPALIGGVRILPPPELGHMNFAWAKGGELEHYIRTRLLCSEDTKSLSGWWILTGAATNVGPSARDLNLEFQGGARLLGITDQREFSLRYMARDLSQFNSPEITVVLPGPLYTRVESVDEASVRLTVRVHRSVGLANTWASVDDGSWDLQHERSSNWELLEGEAAWEHAQQVLQAGPASKVHIGRERLVEMTLDVPEPASTTISTDSSGLLARLYARFRADSMDAIISPAKRDKNSAPDFELLVRNLLGDAGIPVIDLGHEFQMEGIDVLALDHNNARAHAISITLGHGIEKKAKDLAGNRAFIHEGLPGWALTSIVISAIPRADLSSEEEGAAAALSVRILAREDVDAAVADRTVLGSILDFDNVARPRIP